MSFVSKFKSANTNPTDLPQGVNLAHTSFGYNKNQTPYSMPTLAKPTNTNTQKIRPRGGWDDDDEEEDQSQIHGGSGPYRGNQTNQPSQPTTKPAESQSFGFAVSKKKVDPNIEFALLECDSNFLQAHEHENNIINDLIQPGGARLKQPDNLLNNFCRASENFESSAIGSLLLAKLVEDTPFVSKARTLFAIETLVKKIQKYFNYFKHNLPILQSIDFSAEGSNAPQLHKIVEDISNFLLDIQKPKPTPQFTQPNITKAPVPQSGDLLGGNDDLLGFGTTSEQPKTKHDPFAFVSKQPNPNTNSGSLLDPSPSSQGQGPTKKFDPFALTGNTVNQTGNTAPANNIAKPSGGLPGNFQKFKAANTGNPAPINNNIQVQTKPVPQASHSNDLLGALGDLTFEASPSLNTNPTQSPTIPSNQQTSQNIPQNPLQNTQNNQNRGGFGGQPQGFQGPSGGMNNYNQPQQWSYGGNQPQGMNVNMNMGMGSYGNNNNQYYGQQGGYYNQGYQQQPQGNFGYGFQGNNMGSYGGMNNGFNSMGGLQGSNNVSMMDKSKRFDEMYNLVHQEFTVNPEEDKKKKQKSENEKAFDALKF